MIAEQPIHRLARALPPEVDAALIVSDVNRRYYTGMASSAGTLLVSLKGAEVFIDFLYIEKSN